MKLHEEERLTAEASPQVTERARCFGRDQELAELVALVEGAVRDDLGRVVLLSGEPGIGKSRLVAALGNELAGRDLLVLEGRCRDGVHHAATYRPFVEIVDAAIVALDAANERGVAERGREVREALDGRAVPGAVGTAWVERRAALFDAVVSFLIDASHLLRLSILIHDLDAADRATSELCVHLATTGAPADALASGPRDRLRGALVLTGRSLEASLVPGAAVSTVELRALDQDGVRAFLQSPEVVAFFAEATGGRPRALEALLESMPLDADELLRARWQRLSPAAQQLAGALAVVGRATGLVELSGFAQVDNLELARAVQELEGGRVVRRQIVRGEILLSFFRRGDEEAIYSLVADAARAALHLRAGVWLADNGRDDLLDRVRVAEHLLRGGAGVAAVDAALRAADALELTYGYDRAIDLLRRAGSAAAALANMDDTVAAIDERLCELERAVGDYDAALATAHRLDARRGDAASRRRIAALLVLRDEVEPGLQALAAAEQLAAFADDPAAETARIAAARAEALLLLGRTAEAKQAAEAALLHDGDCEAPARRLEVQNTLGKIALAESRYADAAAIFSENVAPARAIGNAFEESRALFNLGIAELRVGDHASAQGRYKTALDVAERAADHRNRAFCLQNLGVLSHWRGDYADALQHFQAAVSAFRRTGLRARLAWVALDLASVYLDLGDVTAAEATGGLVEQLGARGMPPKIAIDRALLSARVAALGARAADARMHAAYVQRAAAGHQPERVVEAGQLLVRLDLDDGNADGAQRCLSALPQSRSDRTQLRTDLLTAELHLLRGRGLEARRLLRDALVTAQRIADLECEWRAQFLLGRAAEALRDGTEAERRFRAALSADRRLRDRVPAAQRAGFEAMPLRRALEKACGLPQVVALPVAPRAPRLVEAAIVEAAPLVGRLIGNHPRMRQVAALVERAAPADSIVLIRGESGTGKELVAEALHEGSQRRGRPFIKVNCGAIVESLLLSELFGHERGAFTGAMQRKKGRFEVADGGTIFLDEIGDISQRTQVALLRVLQERQFERVGGTTPVHVDVRILCATHRNLEDMVARGEFREDLYYRLRGIQIELPPLRERPSDVGLIAQAILANLASQRGAAPFRLTADALQLLSQHAWPGNVRELENVLRSASVFADGSEIAARDLGELVTQRELVVEPTAVGKAPTPIQSVADPSESTWTRLLNEGLSLKELKTRIEVECIERALAASGGNITRAAEKLGMKRPRLSQLIKEHGLRAELNHDDSSEQHPDAHDAEENR